MKTLKDFLEARMIATGDFRISASGRKVRRLIKIGDDDYNKDYKQSTNRIYGDRIIRVDNDFIKDEKKIEVNFVPTLFLQDKTTSRYYSIINSTNNNSGQLRLLYYSGVSNCTAYNVYETAIASGTFFFKYPLTLHIDSVTNMQFDLNFGMSKYILAGKGLQFSNQNLVNVYWFKTLSEITDKNSKIFIGKCGHHFHYDCI